MSLGITNVTWSNTHNDSRSSGFKSHLAHFGYPSPKKKNEKNPPPPPPLLPPSPTKKENLLGNGTFQFTLRQFLILQETETLEKLLIFQEVTFRAQDMKKPTLRKLLILQQMELLSPKVKKTLTYQEGILKS